MSLVCLTDTDARPEGSGCTRSKPGYLCPFTLPKKHSIALTMVDHPKVRFLDRTTPPHVVTLVLLAGLSALTMNIFLPSLPKMAEEFETDHRVMQLSVSLFLLATALMQIVIGPVSDRYGRRSVLLVSIALFLGMTLGTIFATSPFVFLVFRMGQAVSAAGIVLSRAIIRDMVGPDQAASKIGYVTMGMSLVPMFAPAIGGLLDTVTGWRGSFWLMFFAGLLVLGLTYRDVGETTSARPSSMRDQLSEYPELLTSHRFWGYALTAAFCSGAFFAYLGGAPFVGADVYGLDPATLGLYFGAPAIGYAVGNFISGRFSVRLGINKMILIGCLLQAGGLAISPIAYASGLLHPTVFFGCVTFVGLGNGLALPNATSGMLSVRPRLAGTASGLGGAIMIGGGAILSGTASLLMAPGNGPYPLQFLMLSSALCAICSIAYVLRREHQLSTAR